MTNSTAIKRPLGANDTPARIAVTCALAGPALDLLRTVAEVEVPDADRPLSADELRSLVAGADAVVVTVHDKVDRELLDAAGPALKIVANVAVGYDNVDVAACADRGLVVTNTPGVLTDATADLAIGLLMSVTRRLAEGDRMLRAGTSWSFRLDFLLGCGMQGKTLGIVGLGQIGRAVAQRARAFGMKVAYTGERASNEVEQSLAARYVSMDALLREADFVSLHCPLTPQTSHLMDAAAFDRMKPTAFLVNTSRGPIVDESALADALEAGAIAGAALDVFEEEPRVEPRLLAMDNVVLAPHLGSATLETRTEMAVLAARNVVSVLTGSGALTPISS
ncbi:2-hydroxyacid dehydrogenase [Streptomyces purpurogeneiscleroticus]|uniref:2-hydroxyacid dehydrogenase n=1 Tax=Streptomyces purpurogeneiscleroticus TaxID=68259 RepID=UPI001CC1BFAF|nr:D-glycerate dehydrogenase [Streptomyces purpurogeneiscleroticus]MBZ4017638.1 D-glycerate dehydrogenase [Streptomyces purpurogeneiscleroticus]